MQPSALNAARSASSLALSLLVPVLTLTAWSSPPVINPLSAKALSFGQCINGADMECHAEVSEVTIELEVLRCVCHAPSGPSGPTRLFGS